MPGDVRPQSDDLLQSFRFHVVEGISEPFLESAAGFNNVTTPETSVEVAEYREGNRKYTIKQPGVPTVESCTMTRGIAITERNFADWLLEKVLGGQPYRTLLNINVYDQADDGTVDTSAAKRSITCKEAFPSRVKLIGDLDATSSDINLQEIETAVEEVVLSKPV